jgi:glutathione gamma-glutamylcysteinyltransferase
MQSNSFYRRPLPEGLVHFACAEGRAIFREALAEGNLEGWFALAEQFHTQADPAFCGLGTLVVALNALGVDPGRLWKGPWRWYSEELLDCCLPLDTVRSAGVTLDQFACLARCNGATTQTHRATESSLGVFRADLRAAATTPAGSVVAAAYSRRALGQTGDGHYSPVAGIHAKRDLALVLDVARFKYPPHWVPIATLWEAMQTLDPATGRSRGWVTLRRRELGAAVLFRLSDARLPWAEIARRMLVDLPSALCALKPERAGDIAQALVRIMPPDTVSALTTVTASLETLAPEHRAQAVALREALRATKLHAEVVRALKARDLTPANESPVEVWTMLLLALPDATFEGLAPAARDELAALRRTDALPAILRTEAEILREQMVALDEAYGASEESCTRCGPTGSDVRPGDTCQPSGRPETPPLV